MEITNVTKRRHGTINVSYIKDGKSITLIVTPEEIVKNWQAAQLQLETDVCDCGTSGMHHYDDCAVAKYYQITQRRSTS